MATDTALHDDDTVRTGEEDVVEHVDHPTEGQYWKIFFLLFGITALEVALYYKSIPGVNLNNGALGVLATPNAPKGHGH